MTGFGDLQAASRNQRLPDEVRERAIAIIRERYADFEPQRPRKSGTATPKGGDQRGVSESELAGTALVSSEPVAQG